VSPDFRLLTFDLGGLCVLPDPSLSPPPPCPRPQVVPLRAGVPVQPEVEGWLGELDAAMRGTLRTLLTECLGRGPEAPDLDRYPAQVLTLREAVPGARDPAA